MGELPNSDQRVDPARTLSAAAATWFVAGGALLFFVQPLSYWLTGLLMWPVGAMFWIIGLAIFGFSAVCTWRWRGASRRRAVWALLAVPGFFAITAVVGSYVARAGDSLAFRVYFALHQSEFRRIAQTVARGELRAPDSASHRHVVRDGVHFDVDTGPPMRIAFPRPGGLLDNWEGVVYDPTDAVRVAQGWSFSSGKQEFTAPAAVRTLFGGDIVACELVTEHFYRCWFT